MVCPCVGVVKKRAIWSIGKEGDKDLVDAKVFLGGDWKYLTAWHGRCEVVLGGLDLGVGEDVDFVDAADNGDGEAAE